MSEQWPDTAEDAHRLHCHAPDDPTIADLTWDRDLIAGLAGKWPSVDIEHAARRVAPELFTKETPT